MKLNEQKKLLFKMHFFNYIRENVCSNQLS